MRRKNRKRIWPRIVEKLRAERAWSAASGLCRFGWRKTAFAASFAVVGFTGVFAGLLGAAVAKTTIPAWLALGLAFAGVGLFAAGMILMFALDMAAPLEDK